MAVAELHHGKKQDIDNQQYCEYPLHPRLSIRAKTPLWERRPRRDLRPHSRRGRRSYRHEHSNGQSGINQENYFGAV
jgi:hypothetical protein